MASQNLITPDSIRAMKAAGRRIAALTAYDFPTARLLDEAGVPLLLVGDSLGMVVLGYPDTTSVTLAEMAHHIAAVARAKTGALVVGDLPYQTYASAEQACTSGQVLMEAGARALKLEGGVAFQAQIAALIKIGIPVMGHIGMLPQSVREEGGYKIKGRTLAQRAALLADARAIEAAGAFAVVLELVEAGLAGEITQAIGIPTIGIGSGPHCDGEILVTPDLLGSFPWFRPKFVIPLAEVGETIRQAARQFCAAVERTGNNGLLKAKD